jgi:hypothetical protein
MLGNAIGAAVGGGVIAADWTTPLWDWQMPLQHRVWSL